MNKEKLKGYWEKVKTTLGKVSKKIWILIAVVLVLIIAASIYFYTNRPYAVLIDGASDEETATVTSWLTEQGVTDWKMQGTGTILVPEGQATSLKARLLQQQYSTANVSPSGYFERVGALSTQVDRDRAWLLDLQDRMEQTIRQFPGVRDVTVTINAGEDQRYVLYPDHVVNASASVLLTMDDGKLLTSEQGNAIRNYVSHGVPNLDVDDVDVRDTLGNTYDSFFGVGDAESDSALKLQLEQEWNNRLRTQIMQKLIKAYGEDHVDVTVNSEVELGNKTVNTHDVTLPKFAEDGSTNGRGILGSEFWAYSFRTNDEYATGGVVGTTTNAELPTYVEPGEAEADLQGIMDEEANRIYDNPTTDTEMVIHCGTLVDVSVSAWIDGSVVEVDVEAVRANIAAAANIPPTLIDEETGEEYDNWKLSVINEPFYHPAEPEPEPEPEPGKLLGLPYWVFIAAGAGLLLFAILLTTILLLLRRRKRRKKEAEEKAMEELLASSVPVQTTTIMGEDGQPITVAIGPDGQPIVVDGEQGPELDEDGNPVTGANVMDLHTERSMELRQSIRDFVDENMEVAALLLKSWMKEDGDNG